MKTLIALLASCHCLLAQNVLVRFWSSAPLDSVERFNGIPLDWIWQTQPTSVTNLVTGWDTNMTISAYKAYRASVEPSVNAWRQSLINSTNALKAANLAALVSLFGKVDNGLILTTNLFTTITNVENSLASGTNTQAQVVFRIRQLNGVVNDQNRIVQGVLELLQRLFPPLKEIYQTSQGQ